MSQKFANAARSRLAAGINASVTTFTVELSTADLFPIANTPDWLSKNDWFKATIQNALGQFEIIYVGVRASGSGVFSNVLRGQEGTTASAWNAGDVVGLRLTALDHESLVNIKTVDNTFEGSNTFDQPIIGDLQGNADTASLAAVATLANAVVDAAVSTPKIVDSAVTTPKINDAAVTTPKINDGAVTLGKVAVEVLDRLVPAGGVIYFAMNTPPAGWLKANGAAVSRTTYAALFAAIGTTFGVGNGSTTFNLPDLRGEFIRGWDDSRGIDSGRVFGSAQAQAIQSHTHTAPTYSSDGVSTLIRSGSSPQAGTFTTDATGGAETRPRNIALLACIKY